MKRKKTNAPPMGGSKQQRSPKRVTANDLLWLLAARHAADVFVPECKDGPSQGCQHLRLDAWAMSRSWTRPATFGYEIKVSRSDWVGDVKWHNYLGLCNCFSFVAPVGVIETAEVPAGLGLLTCNASGTRLFTRVKAAYREVTLPESLYRYLLMSRMVIARHPWITADDDGDATTWWRRWLEERDEDRELGRSVSRALRRTVESRITRVEHENVDLRHQIERLTAVKDVLERHGWPDSSWGLERRLADLKTVTPPELDAALKTTITVIERLQEQLRRLAMINEPGKEAQ